jgi:hypothetical protein
MKKISFFIPVLLVIAVLVHGQLQWNYINSTQDVPYKNLGDFSVSGGCLIKFFIEYNDNRYPIVVANADAGVILAGNKLSRLYLFPLYLNEVMRYGWAIDVDQEEYNRLRDNIVDPKLIALYTEKKLYSDTSIVLNGRIKKEFAGESAKAIMYVLLEQGINCCQDDESGVLRLTP